MRPFRALFHFLIQRSRIYTAIRNRVMFRGLGCGRDVTIQAQGHFFFGRGCSVGDYANLTISENSSLTLADHVYVGRSAEMGGPGRISIGERTTLQDRCIILGDVEIGASCIFAPNVYVSSGRHYFSLKPADLIRDQDAMVHGDEALLAKHSQAVRIGEDCWLGIGVAVMPGVEIGRGCVIGANAVVTKDIPPYSIAVGAPARTIRARLTFAPPEKIESEREDHRPYFYSGFDLAHEYLRDGINIDGLRARRNFCLSLRAQDFSSTIRVLVKAESSSATISHGGTRHVVGQDYQTLGFPLTVRKGIFVDFELLDGVIILQAAWCE